MNTAAFLLLLSTAPALAPNGLPLDWEPLTFPKIPAHTTYEWSASSSAIHAVAVKAASGLIFRHQGPVADTPILRWRWKISGTILGGDEHEKSGDDYAARLYITFKYEPSRVGLATRLKYGAVKAIRGEYPPPYAGIALMTDTDNTGGSAEAWYADVTLSGR